MERYRELEQLRRNWKPPVELMGSTPREVKLSAGGIGVACLIATLFLGAIASVLGLSRVATRQAARTQALYESGARTEAVITRHWRTGGEDSQRRIAYEFEHQGQVYRRTVRTPKAIWSRLSVGATIPVRFVQANPELNHPAEWRTSDMPQWLPAATAAGLVAVALVLIFVLRRQMQLLSDGRPAPARVTAHKRGQHGHSIVYEFPLLEGGIGKGRGGEGSKPPSVGATISIVYDRDNPSRSAIYPMSMVRVVR